MVRLHEAEDRQRPGGRAKVPESVQLEVVDGEPGCEAEIQQVLDEPRFEVGLDHGVGILG